MRSIVVSTEKGGVGKTTLALHLAWHFAEAGKRVVLIDLDPQGNASNTLGDGFAPAARLFSTEPFEIPKELPGAGKVALIGADPKLADVERIDPYTRQPIDLKTAFTMFKQNLALLDPHFDVCIIDTPPSTSLKASAALYAGGWVVSPVDLEQWGMQGIAGTIRAIEGIRRRFNPTLVFVGLLPSRFDATSPSQKATLMSLLNTEGYARFVLPAKLSRRLAFAATGRSKAPVWRDATRSGADATTEMRHALKLIEQKVFADES